MSWACSTRAGRAVRTMSRAMGETSLAPWCAAWGRAGARLRVREFVDAAARLDGEVAPDVGRGAEGELVDGAARGLEARVGVLARHAHRHHMACPALSAEPRMQEGKPRHMPMCLVGELCERRICQQPQVLLHLDARASAQADKRGVGRRARAPDGGICGSLSKSICEVPLGSCPYRRRMSGMRLSGTPMPTISWQLGMLTPLIHSVTGCSTWVTNQPAWVQARARTCHAVPPLVATQSPDSTEQ